MSERHPTHFTVTAYRNNLVVWMEDAPDRQAAEEIKARFERVGGTTAVIEEIHDPAETDLTTHTRELLEDINAEAEAEASH